MTREDFQELSKRFVPNMGNPQSSQAPKGNAETLCSRSHVASPERKRQKISATSAVVANSALTTRTVITSVAGRQDDFPVKQCTSPSRQGAASAQAEKQTPLQSPEKYSTPLSQRKAPTFKPPQFATPCMTVGDSPSTVRALEPTNPRVPLEETEQSDEISLSTEPPSEIMVGHFIHDAQVEVFASLQRTNQPRLGFHVLKSQADESEHGFLGRYSTKPESIKFLPRFSGTVEEIKIKIMLLLGVAEADIMKEVPKSKLKKPAPDMQKTVTIVLGEPVDEEEGPCGVQQRATIATQSKPAVPSKRGNLSTPPLNAARTALETLGQHVNSHALIVKQYENTLSEKNRKISELEGKIREQETKLRRQEVAATSDAQERDLQHEVALQLEKASTAAQARMLKELNVQVAGLTEKLNSQTSTPAPSSEITPLPLNRPFSDVFLKIHENDLNAGKYREKQPKTIQRDGKTLLKSRMLQEVKLEMGSGEVMRDETIMMGSTEFYNYTTVGIGDGGDGKLKLVQKLGRESLFKVVGEGSGNGANGTGTGVGGGGDVGAEVRFFICWNEYNEAEIEDDSGEE